MQSIIRFLKAVSTISLFYAISSNATPAINIDEVRTRLSIVEGEYELVSGPSDACISGNYELRLGEGTLSFFAGGGIFAAHIQKERFMASERGCSSNFATRAVENGFENREEVHCPNERISYVRIINAKFVNGELNYKMQTHRVFENIKDSVQCKLKLKENATQNQEQSQ